MFSYVRNFCFEFTQFGLDKIKKKNMYTLQPSRSIRLIYVYCGFDEYYFLLNVIP